MIYILMTLAGAFLYAVKGGQFGKWRRWLAGKLGIKFNLDNAPFDMSLPQAAAWSLLDGKPLSSFGFGLLTLSPAGGIFWLAGVSPSIGEEAGAVGGIRGNWREEGRIWGWKRGLQRGVFLGAMLALAFSDTIFIVAGASFPVAYFLGISIEQILTDKVKASWHLAEWIYGGLIGFAYALHLT